MVTDLKVITTVCSSITDLKSCQDRLQLCSRPKSCQDRLLLCNRPKSCQDRLQLLLLLLLLTESAVQGRERVRTLYQYEDPNPTQPTHGRKKRQNSTRQKRKSRSCQQKSIGSALDLTDLKVVTTVCGYVTDLKVIKTVCSYVTDLSNALYFN